MFTLIEAPSALTHSPYGHQYSHFRDEEIKSNLPVIWLQFSLRFYWKRISELEGLRNLFKFPRVQSGRSGLQTQSVWLQGPGSSIVGCPLSLVLGWWTHSLKSTKPLPLSIFVTTGKWQTLFEFAKWSGKSGTDLQPNRAVERFKRVYTEDWKQCPAQCKGYYWTRSNPRKHEDI